MCWAPAVSRFLKKAWQGRKFFEIRLRLLQAVWVAPSSLGVGCGRGWGGAGRGWAGGPRFSSILWALASILLDSPAPLLDSRLPPSILPPFKPIPGLHSPRFSLAVPRFSSILPRFSSILPRFSSILRASPRPRKAPPSCQQQLRVFFSVWQFGRCLLTYLLSQGLRPETFK